MTELFPDFFASWTERFRPLASPAGASIDPPGVPMSRTPVVDAYLSIGCGLDISTLAGFYTEETYHDSQVGATSTTVRFQVANGYWERLIDRPERFGQLAERCQTGTAYKGLWWQPPGVDLAAAAEIWITAGIFDALSVCSAGFTCCASIRPNNYPQAALAMLAADCSARGLDRPALVWAYDGDPVSLRHSRAHAKQAVADGWEVSAAVIPVTRGRTLTWNDALQAKKLTADDIEEYRYNGALNLAATAAAKGMLIYLHTERREFWFEFRHRLYWLKLDQEKLDKALRELGYELIEGEQILPDERAECVKKAVATNEIANCYPRALYYLANPITDEAWYYWSISFAHGGPDCRNTFTSSQLSSSSDFNKRLLHIAPGAQWDGTTIQLKRLLRDELNAIKRVETIDYIGYSREHECYIFGDVAVKAGKLYKLNAEDYFDFGRLMLKTLAHSPPLAINDNLQEYQTAWAAMVWQAYGARGVIALAFWLGSLFAEQIRKRHKSFPFLEIVGEAASGKSTLIEFLWTLMGRLEYEGFDPLKSTAVGVMRSMCQVSNMPVVLIESDRQSEDGSKIKQFDWDQLKPLFNGRPPRTRGYRNTGNDTYEPPFRGTVVISQNNAVSASPAIMRRICQLMFTRDSHTKQTKRLSDILIATPMESVSGFILSAVMQEKKLLGVFEQEAAAHERYLASLPTVQMLALAKTHGQLAALVECLGPLGLGLMPKTAIDQALLEIERMAGERQQAMNSDHPIVSEFWEVYDYLSDLYRSRGAQGINHAAVSSGLIAVNLKHIETAAAHEHLKIPDTQNLKLYLKTSKRRKFVDCNWAVRSQVYPDGRTTRCWVFEVEGRGDED